MQTFPQPFPTVRFAGYHASIVHPGPMDHTAQAVERWVAMAPARERVNWSAPLPNEAPAGTSYWPRLTVEGVARIGGRAQPVGLEVWPWDRRTSEIGLRPRGARPLAPAELEAWRLFADALLHHLQTMLLHPAFAPPAATPEVVSLR